MEKINCAFPDVKILAAEDNDLSQEIIKYMLKFFQIEPDIVANGEEVLDQISKKEYDMLILDIHMPKKNGIETVKEIRKLNIKQPWVIALTASVLESELQAVETSGFNDCLKKPLEVKELQNLLTKYFKERMISV